MPVVVARSWTSCPTAWSPRLDDGGVNIVRFRNMPRDTAGHHYILLVLVLGMATGSQKFSSAARWPWRDKRPRCIYCRRPIFGTRHRYDLILNLHWGRTLAECGTWKAFWRGTPAAIAAANQAHLSSGPRDGPLYWHAFERRRALHEMLSELRVLMAFPP